MLIPADFYSAIPLLRDLDTTFEGVESGCSAVAVGRAYLFPPLSSGGALVARP